MLSEHDGLGLNTADTPSDNSEAINHGSVTISSNNGVGIKNTVFFENDWCKPLQVDLMNDAVARGYDS